jgi:hypothetical protein
MTSKDLELHRPAPVARDDIVIGTPEQLEHTLARLREHGLLIAVSPELKLADGNRAVKIRHRHHRPIAIPATSRQTAPRRMPINHRIAVGLIVGTIIACLIVAATFGPTALAGAEDVTVSAAPVLISLAAISALVLALTMRTTRTRTRRTRSAHHCPGCPKR